MGSAAKRNSILRKSRWLLGIIRALKYEIDRGPPEMRERYVSSKHAHGVSVSVQPSHYIFHSR